MRDSSAKDDAENRYKFNGGTELNSFFEVNLYETAFRSLDPQLGRFWQVDPRPNYDESLYASMSNNPVFYTDPLGDTIVNGEYYQDNRTMEDIVITNQRPGWSVRGNGKDWYGSQQSGDTYTGIFTPNADQLIQMQQDAMEYVQHHATKWAGWGGDERESVVPENVFGSTSTNKVTHEINFFNTGWGDKVSYSHYAGQVAGKDGVITTDASTSNGAFEGGSISLGIVTVGSGTDLSLSVGIGAFGYEGHASVGLGIGLGQVSIGGSHTNQSGGINGGELTVRPGGGAAAVAAAAAAIYFFPPIAPSLGF